MPLPHDHPLLASALEHADLTAHARTLAPFASVGVELAPCDAPTGCRLGGQAMLPDGGDWPMQRWTRAEVATWPESARTEVDEAIAAGQLVVEREHLAMPLLFLGALDLGALAQAAHDAPDASLRARIPRGCTGTLQLFLSLRTPLRDELPCRVAAAALYAPPGAPLRPRAQPPQPEPALEGVLHLAPRERVVWQHDVWNQVRHALDSAALERLSAATVSEQQSHWFLPAATVEMDGPMPPAGHAALVRIAEVHSIGLFIGDASWVTWVLPDTDLAAGRFDRARATMFVG